MRVVVNTTDKGQASWWLYGAEGERVAWAGEMFPTRDEARRAAIEFRRTAATARFEAYRDEVSRWRWRAWRQRIVIATSGETFASKSEAHQAAVSVRTQAGRLPGM